MKRFAVIGLGMALKPHLQSLRELSNRVEIAGCFSPSEARRSAFAAANPGVPVADSLDSLLLDKTIDAALILALPFAHLDLIEQCARHGKHVLVEKPLEAAVERARRAVKAAESANVRLGVVLQHRFRPASLKLARIIGDGALGPLISASASIRWWRTAGYFAEPGRGMKARDGGGVLLTQAIHTLDLFQSLTGPVVKVAAMAATSPLRHIDTEDIAGAVVQFENGAVGTLEATTVAYPGFPERIELNCDKATAVLTAETLEVFFKDGRTVREEGAESKSGGGDPMAFSNEAHKGVLTDFLDALDEGREPKVSGREALKVQVLIEAILQSARTGRVTEVS